MTLTFCQYKVYGDIRGPADGQGASNDSGVSENDNFQSFRTPHLQVNVNK